MSMAFTGMAGVGKSVLVDHLTGKAWAGEAAGVPGGEDFLAERSQLPRHGLLAWFGHGAEESVPRRLPCRR